MNIKHMRTDVLTRKQMLAFSCAQTWRILTSTVCDGGGDDDDHHHHEQQSYFCRRRPIGPLVSTTTTDPFSLSLSLSLYIYIYIYIYSPDSGDCQDYSLEVYDAV
jgi:hypothetical protein